MSNNFALKAARTFFGIFVVLALVTFILVNVQADSSCVCYFEGECQYAEDGTPIRWYQCTGSCYAYSEWRADYLCD